MPDVTELASWLVVMQLYYAIAGTWYCGTAVLAGGGMASVGIGSTTMGKVVKSYEYESKSE
jgi:hypothetical protein